MIKEYLKQLEVSAIVFASKYKNDLFVRAYTIFPFYLLIACSIVIAAIIAVAYYVSNGIFAGVINSFPDSIRILLIVGSISVIAITILGLNMLRITLNPIRNVINSQRTLIRNTAHELRTPLAITRTNIEATLLSKDKSDTSYIQELQRTLVELDSFAGIINDLATFNALTNLEPSEFQHCNLSKIVHEIINTHHQLIAQKKINVTVHTDESNQYVWGNYNALKQMIDNVLGNAISYTDKNGVIKVTTKQLTPWYVRLTIEDSGIGIPATDLPNIFKPFYRTQKSKEREATKSGLGLSIVREVVRLHLGQISFKSVENKGTVVKIDIPILYHENGRHKSDINLRESKITYDYSRE